MNATINFIGKSVNDKIAEYEGFVSMACGQWKVMKTFYSLELLVILFKKLAGCHTSQFRKLCI